MSEHGHGGGSTKSGEKAFYDYGTQSLAGRAPGHTESSGRRKLTGRVSKVREQLPVRAAMGRDVRVGQSADGGRVAEALPLGTVGSLAARPWSAGRQHTHGAVTHRSSSVLTMGVGERARDKNGDGEMNVKHDERKGHIFRT
ncbi:hypothetical protein SKAU_G00261080 [Synaphobranchus kaupii]|uniref:Uncharacterized protein n=1 Tax=Synaphobranchus kaupii TaxID=118154 RepID=A0A9Q1IPP3_SYNKA|nr:hypothetical protein SKAU_G00261080 [Synaphobranchus kaupii]